jgi:hypothetical protein
VWCGRVCWALWYACSLPHWSLTRVVERAQDLDLLLCLLALGRAEGLHGDLLQAVVTRVAHLGAGGWGGL